jgi:hypothetical protein
VKRRVKRYHRAGPVPEYVLCDEHGDGNGRAIATVSIRANGELRFRCAACHAARERARRARNRPRYNEYVRSWRARKKAA